MKLRVLGEEHIDNYEFLGIEGGFGEGKKAILVRDIAKIHGQSVGNINRIIKNNRQWFEDGIDVIDLKASENFAMLLKQSGFTQNQINASGHIYLLSERGYSMLVKFMNDEKATKIYKNLLNNYFKMREKIRKLEKPDSYMIDDPIERAERWIEERKAYEKLLPKAKYFDSQMNNPGLMTTTEIAKDFGWTANKLNKYLASKKVIYRQGKHWVFYQKYAGKGYGQYEPFPFIKEGETGVFNNLKWTQRGRKFIYDLLAEDGIHPVLEELDLFDM